MPHQALLIAIAGPSCSGKTTLAENVRRTLGGRETVILSMDNYYRDLSELSAEDRAATNFDCPDAIEDELLATHLLRLSRGEAIECPKYDFSTHSRLAETTHIAPHRFVIVEGLFALHWEDIRQRVDLRVYVESRDGFCLARRIARDVTHRGRTPDSVLNQYTATVRPMRIKFIEPTKHFADIVVNGGKPVSETACQIVDQVKEAAQL
ncbi:MAG: uridine kinase [Pirellulaceae bacterium]|jgi:uridine kinase|nr:uridine kinase [Pirellulaceae bacterium]MDP7019235.1 uridine kinase [Pirellulaceae bacterium]